MNSPPTPSSSPDPLLDRLCAPDAGGANLPRALLVVAHPDDETLGAGARLHRFADLHILHLTDGAPRDPRFARRAGLEGAAEYAAVRRRELGAAMAIAGVPEDRLHALGAVDQDAAYELVRLTRAIADFVDMLRPEVVLTHPYEGGHPDHDAAAFVVAAAALEHIRRRDGAIDWALYRDSERDTRFVETFHVPSWLEHLRQHERITVADRLVEQRVRAFQRAGAPVVTHLLGTRP